MNEINAFLLHGERTALQNGDVIRYCTTKRQLSFHRGDEVIGIQFQRQSMQEACAIEMPITNRDFFVTVCNLLAANQGLRTQKHDNPWAIVLAA